MTSALRRNFVSASRSRSVLRRRGNSSSGLLRFLLPLCAQLAQELLGRHEEGIDLQHAAQNHHGDGVQLPAHRNIGAGAADAAVDGRLAQVEGRPQAVVRTRELGYGPR